MTQFAHPFRRSVRGMTMLELIVSITILAALATLTATLFGQVRAWTGDNDRVDAALSAERARALLARQWSARVALEAFEHGGAQVDASGLRFVTTESVLFPGAPLVIAEWVIELDEQRSRPGEEVHRLIYDETRLTNMEAPIADALDEARPEHIERIVALPACRAARWERLAATGDWVAAGARQKQIETPPAVRFTAEVEAEEIEWSLVVQRSR